MPVEGSRADTGRQAGLDQGGRQPSAVDSAPEKGAVPRVRTVAEARDVVGVAVGVADVGAVENTDLLGLVPHELVDALAALLLVVVGAGGVAEGAAVELALHGVRVEEGRRSAIAVRGVEGPSHPGAVEGARADPFGEGPDVSRLALAREADDLGGGVHCWDVVVGGWVGIQQQIAQWHALVDCLVGVPGVVPGALTFRRRHWTGVGLVNVEEQRTVNGAGTGWVESIRIILLSWNPRV